MFDAVGGGAIFKREALVHARRPRTYVFQTIFLAGLVLILVPLWPAGSGGGAAIASVAKDIFEYGSLFQLVLIALVAPVLTASAITSEKDKHTLELLILTDAGPFAIVFGKLLARFAQIAFLLFLSLPVIFALLTLGGIDARSIGVAFAILLSSAFLGGAIGVFFSTVLRKTTMAILGGYAVFAAYIAAPVVLQPFGVFVSKLGAGTYAPATAYTSPWYDLVYLFEPSHFVARESFPELWWVNPLLSVGAGVCLSLLAAVLLTHARGIDKALGLKPLFDLIDRGLLAVGGQSAKKRMDAERSGPKGNPIYWKETAVNALGRLRHWWRVNLLIALLMVSSYGVVAQLPSSSGIPGENLLQDIMFHKVVGGILAGLTVLTATAMAATSVAKEREDRTLFVLATTPVDCSIYVVGKVQGILRNLSFLLLLPLIHVTLFVMTGTINWPSLIFVILGVPVCAISAIVQGTFVSLVFPTTLRAIVAAIALLTIESMLPVCTCLHTFNPVLLLYYGIESPLGAGTAGSLASGSLGSILFLSCVFSLLAHVGLTSVVYSLMRSGFDRYIGRAG
jgi:ABC-type transport system involved in multi-copper enzyme maturation permease subunit